MLIDRSREWLRFIDWGLPTRPLGLPDDEWANWNRIRTERTRTLLQRIAQHKAATRAARARGVQL
jgi:hypothetical protein